MHPVDKFTNLFTEDDRVKKMRKRYDLIEAMGVPKSLLNKLLSEVWQEAYAEGRDEF